MIKKYNSDQFRETLIDVGLAKDDNVFIHSSLKTIGKYEDSTKPDLLNMIKDTIFDIIGENGFITVPTFNFNFAKGDDFDVENTPSDGMGAFCAGPFSVGKHDESYFRHLPAQTTNIGRGPP